MTAAPAHSLEARYYTDPQLPCMWIRPGGCGSERVPVSETPDMGSRCRQG